MTQSATPALVSVVVCTRNRAALLDEMLDTATRLRLPERLDWELIVVDNGSTDDTAEVVGRYRDRLPLRRVDEPRIGLSHARNRGVSEARGRYLCWTDDDVRLDPDWLAAYLAAFERHPEAAVFGGRILPAIEPPTPRWFSRCSACWPLTSIMAERDMGDEESEVSLLHSATPYGANFAIRADEQRYFGYDTGLGVVGDQGLMAEESQLIYRIITAGGSGWWVPDSRVFHRIGPGRQTRRHLLSYFIRVGQTLAQLHDQAPGDNCFEIDGPPPFARRSTPTILFRAAARLGLIALAVLRGRTCAALGHWAFFGQDLGVIRYRMSARDPGRA